MTRLRDAGSPPADDGAAVPLLCVSFRWTTEHEMPASRARRFALLGSTRTAVDAVMGAWGVDQLVAGNVSCVLYELAANAVEHGALPITIVVDHGHTGSVTVAVTDAGEAMPVLSASDQREGGQRPSGLELVDVAAQVWDVTQLSDGGKTVTAVVVPTKAARSSGGRPRRSGQAVAAVPP